VHGTDTTFHIGYSNPTVRVSGLSKLGEAFLKFLPDAVKACEGTEQQIADIVKALSAFKSPEAFAYHVGKDLWVNKVNIFWNVNTALTNYHQQVWQAFGYHLGLALKEILLCLTSVWNLFDGM